MLTSPVAPMPFSCCWSCVDVGRDLRPDVRVHAGRERPLVLAELGQHVRGERHREARVEPLDDLADPLLVGGVDVRVDQADRQRLDTRLDEVADDRLDLRLVDLDDRLAARPHPLDGLARVRERGRRIGLLHDDPAGQRPGGLRAREVEDLGEALRRDQPDAGALRLEDGVRRHRRPVEDVAEVSDARRPTPRRSAEPRRARPPRGPPGSTASSPGTACPTRSSPTRKRSVNVPPTSTPSLNAIPLLRRQ